jgi:hypothetical protein
VGWPGRVPVALGPRPAVTHVPARRSKVATAGLREVAASLGHTRVVTYVERLLGGEGSPSPYRPAR